jgi:hypothetical protein
MARTYKSRVKVLKFLMQLSVRVFLKESIAMTNDLKPGKICLGKDESFPLGSLGKE